MSKKETTTTEIVPVNFETQFPVLFAQVDIGEAMRANFEGESLSPRELFYQVKVPSGGSTEFLTIDADGEEVNAKEIKGIILHIGNTRAYHEGKFGSGDKVPTCASEDGEIGEGTPGGVCVKCPMNEFGTADNGSGKGKACNEYKPIYLLVPEIPRPIAIRVSAGSFSALKNYNLDLALSGGIKRHQIVSIFSLKRVKGEPDYSQVVFKKGERVKDPMILERIEAYRSGILPFLKPQAVHTEPMAEASAATTTVNGEALKPMDEPVEQPGQTEQPKTEPMSGGFIHDVDELEQKLSQAS